MQELYIGNEHTSNPNHNQLLYVSGGEVYQRDVMEKDLFNGIDLTGGVDTIFNFGSATNSTLLPGWWSQRRDNELRKASLQIDMISSVINMITMKLYNLPIKVVAKPEATEAHAKLARIYDAIVQTAWTKYAELFFNDMLTYDKGAFFLIESDIGFSRPLVGVDGTLHVPTGLKYVNSRSIMLTRDETLPYIWMRDNESNVKIHESRVIRFVQFPVQVNEVTKVGLSFTSRAFNVGQLLAYAMQNGLESLGALESDTIIYATGTSGNSLKTAFKDARRDSQNESRFRAARDVLLAIKDSAGKVGSFNRNRLPQGFTYDQFASLAIKLMAVAAGVDEDDIAAATNAGTTKTATLISELKSRGKLIAWVTKQFTTQLETFFLPDGLMVQFGSVADNINESKAKALINVARVSKINAEIGVVDERESRVNALVNGGITQSQFENMELKDGRLPNGLAVRALFFTSNVTMQKLLDVGNMGDVCALEGNNADEAMRTINKRICFLEGQAIDTTSPAQFKNITQAIAALTWLLDEYERLAVVKITSEPESEPELEPELDVNTELSTEEEDKERNIADELEKSFKDSVEARRLRRSLAKQVRNVWNKSTPVLQVDAFLQTLEELAAIDPLVRHLMNADVVDKFLAIMKDIPEGTKLKELTTPLREFTGSP